MDWPQFQTGWSVFTECWSRKTKWHWAAKSLSWKKQCQSWRLKLLDKVAIKMEQIPFQTNFRSDPQMSELSCSGFNSVLSVVNVTQKRYKNVLFICNNILKQIHGLKYKIILNTNIHVCYEAYPANCDALIVLHLENKCKHRICNTSAYSYWGISMRCWLSKTISINTGKVKRHLSIQ